MSVNTFLTFIPLLAVAVTAAGLVLLTLGVRGRPVFASPRCAKCGYDLRNMQFLSQESVGNCPECGIKLSEPGAVSFGTWRRQPRRMIAGVLLILLPWIAVAATFAFRAQIVVLSPVVAGPQAKATMTTPALLASLKTTVNSPWDWQELDRRLRAGNLTPAEVDAALAVLTADLNAQRAAGKQRQPLHWADGFIRSAIKSGSATQPQIVALAQAFYGSAPKFAMRSRARQDDPIGLRMGEYEPWNIADMQCCWALTSVVADDKTTLTPQLRFPTMASTRRNGPAAATRPDLLSGTGQNGMMEITVLQSLPPGEHEIALTFEVGVLPMQRTLRGIDGRPGTPDKWPPTVARWQTVVKKKITVRPTDQSPIDLIIDAARDPFQSAGIGVEEAMVRSASQSGAELLIKFKFNGTLDPVVGYQVWVQAGEQKIDYGTLIAGRTSRGVTSSQSSRKPIAPLLADVKQIDILLVPDAKSAERHIDIEEIWGKPYRIDNVPLQRFDLGDGGSRDGAAGAEGQRPTTQAP